MVKLRSRIENKTEAEDVSEFYEGELLFFNFFKYWLLINFLAGPDACNLKEMLIYYNKIKIL